MQGSLYLSRVDPTRNCRRWYILYLQHDLWGGVEVICQWGRIGNAGGSQKVIPCSDLEAAMATVQDIVRKRLRRGYTRQPRAERSSCAI